MRRIPGERAVRAALTITTLIAVRVQAQSITVPLSAAAWDATDSVRSETYLGRPSLYINRGVARAKSVGLENGTIDYDMAATPSSSFLGSSFRAVSPRFSDGSTSA